MKKTEKREIKEEKELVEIIPLKDFKIRMNKFSYDLIEGEKVEVNKIFIPNLKTEKVI